MTLITVMSYYQGKCALLNAHNRTGHRIQGPQNVQSRAKDVEDRTPEFIALYFPLTSSCVTGLRARRSIDSLITTLGSHSQHASHLPAKCCRARIRPAGVTSCLRSRTLFDRRNRSSTYRGSPDSRRKGLKPSDGRSGAPVRWSTPSVFRKDGI